MNCFISAADVAHSANWGKSLIDRLAVLVGRSIRANPKSMKIRKYK